MSGSGTAPKARQEPAARRHRGAVEVFDGVFVVPDHRVELVGRDAGR
ncbi:hypothetical protein ACWEPM_24915 [Streptomyces sp. NPDC004244]